MTGVGFAVELRSSETLSTRSVRTTQDLRIRSVRHLLPRFPSIRINTWHFPNTTRCSFTQFRGSLGGSDTESDTRICGPLAPAPPFPAPPITCALVAHQTVIRTHARNEWRCTVTYLAVVLVAPAAGWIYGSVIAAILERLAG
jgi:hypothetical protein